MTSTNPTLVYVDDLNLGPAFSSFHWLRLNKGKYLHPDFNKLCQSKSSFSIVSSNLNAFREPVTLYFEDNDQEEQDNICSLQIVQRVSNLNAIKVERFGDYQNMMR